MERARVFKTVGKVRIIGPFTLPEVLVVVAIFAFSMEALAAPAVPRFFLSVGVTYGVWWLYAAFKHRFPGAAVRHLATWLSQADRYYPSKDPVSRPLVYRQVTKPKPVNVERAPAHPGDR